MILLFYAWFIPFLEYYNQPLGIGLLTLNLESNTVPRATSNKKIFRFHVHCH